MHLSGNVVKLKIIVGENDQVYQRPLYQAIVYAAKKYKLSGATVTRGVLNYGAGSLNHSIKVFTLSEDLPMVIELIDHRERLSDFAEIVSRLMEKAEAGGIITLEEVEVLFHSEGEKRGD